MDLQLAVIAGLKATRILLSWVALFLATRIFSPMYEDLVYEQRKDPPSLSKYLGIFLGLDLAFNAFILALLALASRVIKSGPLNDAVIVKAAIDYGASMIVALSLGWWVSSVVTLKKYFRYKYEGLRAIRAFERMMLAITTHAHLMPFFMVTTTAAR